MTSKDRTVPDLRLYVLDTVVHPRGTLLWDTGIEDAIAALPAGKEIAESMHLRASGSRLGAYQPHAAGALMCCG